MSDWERGYDAWKLDYPSHWDDPTPTCGCCGDEQNPDTESCENEKCDEFDRDNFAPEEEDGDDENQ